MTDKVKLTKKQIEAVEQCRRIATGVSLDVNPRRRLSLAGIEEPSCSYEVVISVPVEKDEWSFGYGRKTGTYKGQEKATFKLDVVDGEVFLRYYNGSAYGKHEGVVSGWLRGDHNMPPIQPTADMSESRAKIHLLMLKADKVAKLMQQHIEALGEEVPDADEVKRQYLVRESDTLNSSLNELHMASRRLRGADHEASLDLKAEIDDLAEKVLAERNRLDFEALNIERKQQG